MSETIDKTQFFTLNKDEYAIHTHVEQDVSEIIKSNRQEADNSNGFSDGRTMRKVASLSMVDYLNALKLGYGLDTTDKLILTKELNRYLKDIGRDAGLQTVKHILTPNRSNANIIIK